MSSANKMPSAENMTPEQHLAIPIKVNHYEFLCVAVQASVQQIMKAYKKRSLYEHPDKHASEHQQEATKRFQRLQQAIECLTDTVKRHAYDKQHYLGKYARKTSMPRTGRPSNGPSASSNTNTRPTGSSTSSEGNTQWGRPFTSSVDPGGFPFATYTWWDPAMEAERARREHEAYARAMQQQAAERERRLNDFMAAQEQYNAHLFAAEKEAYEAAQRERQKHEDAERQRREKEAAKRRRRTQEAEVDFKTKADFRPADAPQPADQRPKATRKRKLDEGDGDPQERFPKRRSFRDAPPLSDEGAIPASPTVPVPKAANDPKGTEQTKAPKPSAEQDGSAVLPLTQSPPTPSRLRMKSASPPARETTSTKEKIQKEKIQQKNEEPAKAKASCKPTKPMLSPKRNTSGSSTPEPKISSAASSPRHQAAKPTAETQDEAKPTPPKTQIPQPPAVTAMEARVNLLMDNPHLRQSYCHQYRLARPFRPARSSPLRGLRIISRLPPRPNALASAPRREMHILRAYPKADDGRPMLPITCKPPVRFSDPASLYKSKKVGPRLLERVPRDSLRKWVLDAAGRELGRGATVAVIRDALAEADGDGELAERQIARDIWFELENQRFLALEEENERAEQRERYQESQHARLQEILEEQRRLRKAGDEESLGAGKRKRDGVDDEERETKKTRTA